MVINMAQCPIFLEKGSFKLTSPFDPDGILGRKHGGTDGTRDGQTATYICPQEMDGAKVTEILATIKGTENTSGNYVTLTKIIDGVRVALRIKHMAYGSIKVTFGQVVKAGDVLGFMGNTGHSDGAHAHVELIYPGQWVDAYPWLSGETDILLRKIKNDTAVEDLVLSLQQRDTEIKRLQAELDALAKDKQIISDKLQIAENSLNSVKQAINILNTL